jgi:hypothetical protein
MQQLLGLLCLSNVSEMPTLSLKLLMVVNQFQSIQLQVHDEENLNEKINL